MSCVGNLCIRKLFRILNYEEQKTNHHPIERKEEQMSILEVPGTRLFYKIYGSGRFSDGRRSLEQVIDAVIAPEAAHLVTLKRAVA